MDLIKFQKLFLIAFVLDRESGSESKTASDLLRIYLKHAEFVKVLTSSLTPLSEISKLKEEFNGKIEINVLKLPRFFLGKGRAILLLGIRYWHRKALKSKVEQDYFSGADLGVHLSFATFLFGTPLNRISIPYIFGPAGFSMFSRNSLRIIGIWSVLELFRNLLVKLTIRTDPFVRKSLNGASVVIATDINSKRILQEGIKLSNLSLPIPHISFSSVESIKKINSNRIIWVGQYLKKKDPLLALQIFENVADSFKNLTLHFYGDGPLKNELSNAISMSPYEDRIFMHSWITSKELLIEISNSEILLHTSVRETAGNQILESVLVGTKVITSNRTNLFTWLEIPGVSYALVDSYITRKELVIRYSNDISSWYSLDQESRTQIMNSSREILKCYTPLRLVEGTLHAYFAK